MKRQDPKIFDIVEKSINEFNKYRSPEATAKLIYLKKQSMKISFSGHFCFTCGYQDYFDDLRLILEEFGIKTKIIKIERGENQSLVHFKIVKSSTRVKG
jgi:FAD synthase